VWTLYRMSQGMHETLLDSQRTIEAIATLSRVLEREDDAVLLAISGRFSAAREELGRQRAQLDGVFTSLWPRLLEPGERELAEQFKRHVAEFRQLGEQVVLADSTAGLFDLYHDWVNPALRRAVAAAAALREMHFGSMTQAGIEVEGLAWRAMWVVAGIAVGALLLSSCIAVTLTRRVVGPIYLLTQAADAIGAGDFERQVDIRSPDELERLAAGFNRMAAALGSPPREERALTSVSGRKEAETSSGSAGPTVGVGAGGPAAGDAPLEAVRPDACRASVHGSGMAARYGARISRCPPVGTRPARTPATIARAGVLGGY
jgi:NtrC-family two-component system sensor histidine kinase KinB